MPQDLSTLENINFLISNDELAEAAQLLKKYVQNKASETPPALLKKILGLQGRLASVENERLSGTVSLQEYNLEKNKIRESLLHYTSAVSSGNFAFLLEQETEKPTPSKKESDILDQAFKIAIVILFVLSIASFTYTTFFVKGIMDQLPQFIFSLVGGSGSFFGYSRLKLLELS